MPRLRRRFRVLIFAALVAALVVPLGFALSLESAPERTMNDASSRSATAAAPLAMKIESGAPRASDRRAAITERDRYPISDTVVLLALGTVLLGLAAAVRRAE